MSDAPMPFSGGTAGTPGCSGCTPPTGLEPASTVPLGSGVAAKCAHRAHPPGWEHGVRRGQRYETGDWSNLGQHGPSLSGARTGPFSAFPTSVSPDQVGATYTVGFPSGPGRHPTSTVRSSGQP